MSGTLPANPPACVEAESSSIELVIDARPRDLGGFTVRRLLPSPKRRLVGPFIFFDEMGPTDLPAGEGFDVRPHPHIALATLTYLFKGKIVHRDSVGSLQTIRPGDVNWMVAGRGIAHSERSGDDARLHGMHLHGIQCWAALPTQDEETEPRFEHHPRGSIPVIARDDIVFDVVAGTALGKRSPVAVLSPTLYVHARLEPSAKFTLNTEHEERAVYVVQGAALCDGRRFEAGTMFVLRPGRDVALEAPEAARWMILGGAKLQGERHMYWNFVSSSPERLEQAKRDWQEGRFPKVRDDESEYIPLPEVRAPT